MIFILIWVKCNNEKWRVNMYKMAEKMRRGISFLMIVLVFLAMGMAGVRTSAAEKNTTSINSIRNRNKKSVDEYELSKQKDEIIVKEKKRLSVLNIKRECNIEFSSSDTNVLGVKKLSDNTCEYRGKRVGSADINVKITKLGFLFMPDTTYLKCRVEVSPKAVSIRFTKKKIKIKSGNSKKLKLTTRPSISKEKATFVSSDTDIVQVDSKGRITAGFIGTATITARISNGKVAKCRVEVRAPGNNKKQKN